MAYKTGTGEMIMNPYAECFAFLEVALTAPMKSELKDSDGGMESDSKQSVSCS